MERDSLLNLKEINIRNTNELILLGRTKKKTQLTDDIKGELGIIYAHKRGKTNLIKKNILGKRQSPFPLYFRVNYMVLKSFIIQLLQYYMICCKVYSELIENCQ